jgi:hypothetical protein
MMSLYVFCISTQPTPAVVANKTFYASFIPIGRIERILWISRLVIVKYVYEDLPAGSHLKQVKIACIPSGILQDDYNPTETETIWMIGRNAPSLEEDFRVRLSFSKLEKKSAWRVIKIPD